MKGVAFVGNKIVMEAELTAQITKIKDLKTDKDGISTHHVLETNNMLLKWLLNHISKVDTKLGAFINSGTP